MNAKHRPPTIAMGNAKAIHASARNQPVMTIGTDVTMSCGLKNMPSALTLFHWVTNGIASR